MGGGKTTAAINMINGDTGKNYVYVTPYKDEVKRIIDKTDGFMKQPRYENGGTKLDDLHNLLAKGESIVTTHALFLRATPETVQLIHEGGYTLVLDEALSTLQKYNNVVSELENKAITGGDVEWLKEEGIIEVDEHCRVTWKRSKKQGFHFSEVEALAAKGCLRCVDNVLFWEYPYEVLTAFEEIFILTYLFEGSQFDSYIKAYGLGEYQKLSTTKNETGEYMFCSYMDDVEQRKSYAERIHIYEGGLNCIGEKRNSFSVNWLDRQKSADIKAIRNKMRCYKESVGVPSRDVMWTTIKETRTKADFYKKFEAQPGFKYIRKLTKEDLDIEENELKKLRCFVPCNARATNSFSDRHTLLYLLNRFLDPEVKKYYAYLGYPLNESLYAKSELLQWIWRSAIRNGESINLYIPSKRMRYLLYDWLNVQPPDEPRTVECMKAP